MTVRQLTAEDYADDHPEIEETAEQLRTENDPRLVARFPANTGSQSSTSRGMPTRGAGTGAFRTIRTRTGGRRPT